MSNFLEVDEEITPSFLIRDWIDFSQSQTEVERAPEGAIGIYLRLSARETDDLSIKAQLEATLAHIPIMGGRPDRERLLFVDRNRSGMNMEGREAFGELREAIRSGLVTDVLTARVDRLMRKASHAAAFFDECDAHGARIHVAGKGQIRQMELVILALSAQRERERLGLAFRNGKRNAALRGALYGCWPVFGYDQIENDWRINPEQAALIMRCFLLLDEGMKAQRLCKLLNREGVKPPIGTYWHYGTLFQRGRGMLDKPLLKGLYVLGLHNGDPVIVRRPDLAIVEADFFDRVNRRYGKPGGSQKVRATPAFLGGLARCACGHGICVSDPSTYSKMHCKVARLDGGCQRTEGLHSGELARQVLRLFREEVLDPERGPGLEDIRRRHWEALDAEVGRERDALTAEIEDAARAIEARSSAGEGEIAPLDHAHICALEIRHHNLAAHLAKLAMPPFRAVDWDRAAILRAAILRLMERLPFVTAQSAEEAEALELVHAFVIGIEIDIGRDEFATRVEFGIVALPKGFKPSTAIAEPILESRSPRHADGPLRFPEVVLGHHRRADEGAFTLDDGDWEAIELLFPTRKSGVDGRTIAEALLFEKSTALAPPYLPEPYAEAAALFGRWSARAQAWPRMFDILRRRGSPKLAEIGGGAPICVNAGRPPCHAFPVPPVADPVPWSPSSR